MTPIIDLLASEYGWSKKEILEQVYPDEIEIYDKKISYRRLSEYAMQLQIVSNPHVKDPKKLFRTLQNSIKSVYTNNNIDNELDREGLVRLKRQLSGQKGSKIKLK